MSFAYGLKVRALALTQWALLGLVAFAVVNYGSADDNSRNGLAIAFACLAVAAAFRPMRLGIGRLHGVAVCLLAVLAVSAFLQTMPFADGDFANGAWKSVNEKIGPVAATISVAPTTTLESIPSLALPFFVFLAMLAMFQGDAEALRLWRALSYFSVGCAIFGLLQQIFLPDQMLFQQKTYYQGSLTATFVNRNTAGAFFGLGLLLNLGLTLRHAIEIRAQRLLERLRSFDFSWRDKYGQTLLHAGFCLVNLMALALTQSRGATGASLIGAAVGFVLMLGKFFKTTGAQPSARWRLPGAIVLGSIGLFVVFEMVSGRAAYRMQEEGADQGRYCAYASTIQAIEDHPIFGTGFGTFQDVFPLYRDVDCVGTIGIWDRAHNSFLEGYLGLGVPFACMVLVAYAILLTALVRGFRNRHAMSFAPALTLGALVFITLHSLIDFPMQIPGLSVFFAAVMASGINISLGRLRG